MKKSMWFWDWIARWYDKRARVDEDLTSAIERCEKYLAADDTVLDFACGTGVVTYKIAADVKEVLGIDASAGRFVSIQRPPVFLSNNAMAAYRPIRRRTAFGA